MVGFAHNILFAMIYWGWPGGMVTTAKMMMMMMMMYLPLVGVCVYAFLWERREKLDMTSFYPFSPLWCTGNVL